MRRLHSDIDGVVASVLATAGALASYVLLSAIAGTLDTSAVAPLVEHDTLGRLWVFFVLGPALLVLVAVGLPCLLRTFAALARGSLGREGTHSLVLVAGGVAFVVAEAASGRSGTTALAVVCALCLWRLFPLLRGVRDTQLGLMLLIASAATIGFGVYQHRLQTGEAPSVAVAPTLFLVTFYATLVGVVSGLVGAAARGAEAVTKATASLVWLVIYATWIVGAERWGATSTYGVGALLGALAVWLRAVSAAHRIDEGRAII